MKNIKKTAILLMVLGVAVLTGRCVSEESGSEQKIEQSIKVSQARVWFEQYQSKVKIDSSFKSQIYNWDSAITETFENGTEAIVVPVRDNNLSDAYIGQKVLYLYPLENKKEFSATLYEILPLSESLEKIKISADLVNFNGYIIAWDLERGFVNGAKFENSNTTAALTGLRVISPVESERLNKSTAKSDSDPFELDEVIIRREKSENKQEYGGGAYGGSLKSGSKGNSPKGYVKSPGGGGSGSSGSTTSPNAQRIEEQINADKLDACPKDVLERLKKTKNIDIAAVLSKLGSSKVFIVEIESSSVITRPASASTTNIPNNYNIKVSSNYTSATQLFRASNLLHEIIHCYFFSLVDEYAAKNDPEIFNNFPMLFQKFVDKKYPGSKDSAHHDEMANTYVNAIGAALQEFQTGFPVPKGEVPNQIYKDLAWGGLQEAPIFKQKFPEGSLEYNRIIGRYNGESVNSTINGQTPKGKPCAIK